MPREPTYIRNFKAFAGDDQRSPIYQSLKNEIYGANDRARAVMLGTVLVTSLAGPIGPGPGPEASREFEDL